MPLIDLSHRIDDGMVTYPGFPGPRIGVHLDFDESAAHYAPGTEFTIGSISMVGNTGTYLDTPGHRHRGAADLAAIPLDRCADLPAVVVRCAAGHAIGPDQLPSTGIEGTAVLLRTGWDRHWATDHYGDVDHPHLTAAGAQHLVDAGAALVGIDSVNIDGTADGERPAHTILLARSVLIVEHLTRLDQLPVSGARFFAVPPSIRGLCTFPVRAFAAIS